MAAVLVLNNVEIFCSREKLIGLIVKQQNEKSTEEYTRKIWIRGLMITVTMRKEC